MTFEEAAQHVGDAVVYRPHPDAPGRPGVIEVVKQLVVVKFHDHDGGILQVNPYCLELAESARIKELRAQGVLPYRELD